MTAWAKVLDCHGVCHGQKEGVSSCAWVLGRCPLLLSGRERVPWDGAFLLLMVPSCCRRRSPKCIADVEHASI